VIALFERILAAKRKRLLLGPKPMFEAYRAASASHLSDVEKRIGCPLPDALRSWLLRAGYGDINEELSFREEWFSVIDRGQLTGHVVFAQDILGNSYSFSPRTGEVHYVCGSAPEYAFMTKDFRAFLEELERRSFKLVEWAVGLPMSTYEWVV
jgi:hypothetical protein